MSEEIKDHDTQEAATVAGAEESDDEGQFEPEDALALEPDDVDEQVVIYDADAEDALEEAALRVAGGQNISASAASAAEDEDAPHSVLSMSELMAIIEAIIFVAEEPLTVKTISDVLKEDRGWIQVAVEELAKEFNARSGGLQMREVAGGWQITTRAEHHEHVRAFLKSRPSGRYR